MRTIRIPSRPAPEGRRRARMGDAYPCVVCGLPISKPRFVCHMIGGGGVALHPEDEAEFAADTEAQAGDMGCYPIGGDCLKRHPAMLPFVTKAGGAS